MALRKGLVEPVYGLVLRQSVVGRDGAVVVQRPGGIADSGCVTVGHDGLCFDGDEIVFSWSKAYVARYAFIRAGKLAGMRYPGLRQRAFERWKDWWCWGVFDENIVTGEWAC